MSTSSKPRSVALSPNRRQRPPRSGERPETRRLRRAGTTAASQAVRLQRRSDGCSDQPASTLHQHERALRSPVRQSLVQAAGRRRTWSGQRSPRVPPNCPSTGRHTRIGSQPAGCPNSSPDRARIAPQSTESTQARWDRERSPPHSKCPRVRACGTTCP